MIKSKLSNLAAISAGLNLNLFPGMNEAIQLEQYTDEFFARCRSLERQNEPKVKNIKIEARELAAKTPYLNYKQALYYLTERIKRAIMTGEEDLSHINGEGLIERINARIIMGYPEYTATYLSFEDEEIYYAP